MRRVDSHHHLWDLAHRPQPWISGPEMDPINRSFPAPEFEELALAHDISASVVVQTVCVPEETPELLRCASDSAVIAGVVGWVDLESEAVADHLAELRSGPHGRYLKGIRHQIQEEPDPHWISRPSIRRGLHAVAEAGLAYDLVIRPDQLLVVAAAVQALPDVSFVLDHAAKPPIASGDLSVWQRDLATLAAFPNVVCKVSGLMTEASWSQWRITDLRQATDHLLDSFGPGRLMAGSDWPVSTLAADYTRVWAAYDELFSALSPTEQERILAQNAVSIYQLCG